MKLSLGVPIELNDDLDVALWDAVYNEYQLVMVFYMALGDSVAGSLGQGLIHQMEALDET